MTSQKRYRQQEGSKSSARFRDLPPRFKRQKSSSIPDSSSLETQKSAAANHSLVTKQTDVPQLVKSPTAMAPSSSSRYPLEENLSSQPRSRTDFLQNSQAAVSNGAAWQWPQKTNGAFILSPWDSRHFNRDNTQPHHVSLGTRFGYQANSPPLSPWASRGTSDVSQQLGVTSNATWTSSHSDPYTNQRIHSPPGYFNNENWAPSQNLMPHRGPEVVWGKSSTQICNNSFSPLPLQIHTAVPTKSKEKTKGSAEVQKNVKQAVDYSDPDLRTIEMLRELERVADEKECEDFGADRKSLVSHHLRMLMCAVDRYTEGIEDDIAVSSRRDEVETGSNSCESTPRTSPGPSEVLPQKHKSISHEAKLESKKSLWSPGYETSVWNDPAHSPVSPTSCCLGDPADSLSTSFSSQQESPVSGKLTDVESHGNGAWDLWSSPSFDFSGLLSQSSEEITSDPFGRFREKKDRERKPLYQR